MDKGLTFERTMTMQVSAQIIKHISAGLYRTPASSLKELLSNSFDADAEKVDVSFYFDRNKYGTLNMLRKITVKDRGMGMNLEDLSYVFSHIGGSKKQDPFDPDPKTEVLKRPRIGRLGIGMLSVAAACKGFVVRTKKINEHIEYVAEISLDFFSDLLVRTESMDKFKIGNVKIYSRTVPGDDFYTEIEISRFTPPFLENLIDRLGDSFIFTEHNEGSIDSSSYIEEFTEYIQGEVKLRGLPLLDQIIADLGLMVPVEYLPNGPIRESITWKEVDHEIKGANSEGLKTLKKRISKYKFKVYCHFLTKDNDKYETVNSFRLFKPILYPTVSDIEYRGSFEALAPSVYVIPEKKQMIPDDDGNNIENSVSGFYYHQSARILPQEYRGLLIRVYDVALGNTFSDPFNMYIDQYLRYQQSFTEVHLNKGFQSIVNLDREGLYEGSNSYRFLKNYILNFFTGESPSSHESSVSGVQEPAKAELEHKFIEEQKRLFPANKDAVFTQVRKKVNEVRQKEIEKAQKTVEQEILDTFGLSHMEIIRVKDVSEINVSVNEGTIQAELPNFTKRRELWESIFITVGVYEEDPSVRRKMYDALMNIYKILERRDYSE